MRSSDDQVSESNSFCTKCGSSILASESFCSKCGAQKGNALSTSRANVSERPIEWKSESTTLILAIVLGVFGISGVGHLYLGKIQTGIILLIGGVILIAIGVSRLIVVVWSLVILIGYLAIFIWQIIDARKLCAEYNKNLSEHGKPPW